eukprot:TRINITY_DN14206_c0_g1_i1.p1 TRINITY_DN14206_c0_g1~~TRINITY_DN14206_c0_g1_i1.p1  ORF type:complete len:186 (+),score=34.69 TRINITY_DN14206_c0_g1_i1:108-665(+)
MMELPTILTGEDLPIPGFNPNNILLDQTIPTPSSNNDQAAKLKTFETLKRLDEEAKLLKSLHNKITDQLHRLQIEEVGFKKELESLMQNQRERMQSDAMSVQFDGSQQTNSQMHEGSFPYFDVSSQLDAVHQLPEKDDEYEGEDEFEDNEEEEEANEQMRQILMRELGSNYVEDEMSDDDDEDFM